MSSELIQPFRFGYDEVLEEFGIAYSILGVVKFVEIGPKMPDHNPAFIRSVHHSIQKLNWMHV